MPVHVPARFLFALSLLLALLASPAPAFAQSAGSQLTAEQTVQPADLTPKELSFYQTLDATAAKDFLATRSYVRLCQQVLDHKLAALQLPDRPAGFSAKYLLAAEPNIINRALADYLVAKESPNHAAQATPLEMTPAQILQPDALSAQERTYYKTLTDPASIQNFIETRSYVRLAEEVAAHKMPAAQLPDKPLGFTAHYLLPGEEATVNQAVAASLAALMKQKVK
jgi:hypothetical protein